MPTLDVTNASVTTIVPVGGFVTVSVEATVEKSPDDQNFCVTARLFKRGAADNHVEILPEISLALHATIPNLYIGTFPATSQLATGDDVFVTVTAQAEYHIVDVNTTMTKPVPPGGGGAPGEPVVRSSKARSGRHK